MTKEEVLSAVKGAQSEIEARVKAAEEQIKNTGAAHEETKSELNNLLEKHKELTTSKEDLQKNFDKLEVEMKKAKEQGADSKKSFAQALYAKFNDNNKTKGTVKGEYTFRPTALKADMSITNDLSGDVIEPVRNDSQYFYDPEREQRVRDLLNIPTIGVNSDVFRFFQEQSQAYNTAVVAEEGTIPSSDFNLAEVNVSVKKIADSITASRELVEDLSGFTAYVATRLGMKINQLEDVQLLTGSGVGANLNGYVTQATAFSGQNDLVDFANVIDVIKDGIRQAAVANYMPSAVILQMAQYVKMFQLKDADGNYLAFHNGVSEQTPRIMGIPVYGTTAFSSDTFLLGDFRRASAIIDRQTVQIDATDSHASQFLTDQIEIKATKRLALAVYNTASFITGDVSDAITAIDIT